jgi:hypothetical protein
MYPPKTEIMGYSSGQGNPYEMNGRGQNNLGSLNSSLQKNGYANITLFFRFFPTSSQAQESVRTISKECFILNH